MLDRLIEHGEADKETIIDSYRDDWDGLTDGERKRFFAGTSASGDPIDEGDIDRVIYEEEALSEFDGE